MRRIRCGRGLGDSLYLQAVARHIGGNLEICSDYPDLFNGFKVSPFSRENIDILAVYTTRKSSAADQFVDCCISAGITTPVDFRIEWSSTMELATDKPIICVAMPRKPMGRDDGFGDELLPSREDYQRFIDGIDGYKIMIGAGQKTYDIDGIDLDLCNKTSITQMMDICSSADGFMGYPSFFIPLCESLVKPGLFLWTRKGLRSSTRFIRQVTPKKLLHRRSSTFVIDDQLKGSNIDFLRPTSFERILPW